MRRLLLLALLVVLPFQFAWGAAAIYCQHEIEGKHFGHHEDTTGNAWVHTADDASDLSPSDPDAGCEFCQLAASLPICGEQPHVLAIGVDRGIFVYQLYGDSYFPPGLERPDRLLAG